MELHQMISIFKNYNKGNNKNIQIQYHQNGDRAIDYGPTTTNLSRPLNFIGEPI